MRGTLTRWSRSSPPTPTRTGNYRELAELLLQARDCHRRLGTDSDFRAYVTELRTAQRRKRNLTKIFDERGL